MSGRHPLVGITVGSGKLPDSDAVTLGIRPTYTRAIAAAGGVPVLIPLQVDHETLRHLYDRLDAVLLTGGGDVEPARYGAETSVFTAGINPDRDEIEDQLVRWAVADDRPLLGICRGHQVMNVALGGTLIQDIREEVVGALRHDAPSDGWFIRCSHEVTVVPGSSLHRALGITGERLAVNSLHHQAIAQTAPELQVVAHADDGIIEGIVHPQRRFIVGVQWHPEALFDRHEPHLHLFEALVSAAQTDR